MNKDFVTFRKCFEDYQQRFGLTGYKVYFKYEPLERSFAEISSTQNDMVATVRLNSKLPSKDTAFKDIKRSAKHEALHLLVQRLEHRARCRHVADEEIYEAVEELVNKLEGLIDGNGV